MGIENPVHLLFIAIVALVVLGPRRLPELARALGKGVREFREAIGQGESAQSAPPAGLQPRIGEEAQPDEPVAVPADELPVAQKPAGAGDPATLSEPLRAGEGAPGADQVDPTQTVRSGGAPDRRPL